MITTSQLGKWGNLGNQLFHIASTIGIAKVHKQDYFFSVWSYENWFETPFPHGEIDESFILVKEKQSSFYDWNLKDDNYDLKGWMQSEKYFDKEKTKQIFTFRSELIKGVLERFEFLFQKKTILISVRRGDFVNHPFYFQLSYKYYLQALYCNFPDWQQYNLIFTSDDIAYCKSHFSFLPNAFFLENMLPMEQLIIGKHCDHFIISNSTFSWWMAWLGEKKHSKIIRPLKNYRGEFAKSNDDSDYFPERWTSFDEKKRPLKNHYRLKIKATVYNCKTDLKYYTKKNWNLLKKKIKKTLNIK